MLLTQEAQLGQTRTKMINVLISLGLILIPLVFHKEFAPRDAKMGVALVIALLLGLLVIYRGKLKAFKNKWVMILLAYYGLSFYFLPRVIINNFPANFWVYKPLLFISIFFLMLLAISSMKIKEKYITLFFNIIVGVGSVISLLAIAQYFEFIQWFLPKGGEYIHVPHHRVVGTLGQPTLLAPFIAMIIPIAFYIRRYALALLFIGVVCLTKSWIGIGSTVFSLIFLLGTKKNCLKYAIVLFLLAASLAGWALKTGKVSDSGRSAEWLNIIEYMKEPLGKENYHAITGAGIGSHRYTYGILKDRSMKKAHNDYLQIISHAGIGIIFFLMSIFYMFKINLYNMFYGNRLVCTLLASFVCIALSAFGTFVWQLGPTIFYSIFIFGLLHNDHIVNQEVIDG